MNVLRTWFALTALVLLSACSAKSVWAPDDHVQKVQYADPGPAYVTLFTGYHIKNGRGSHSGLMVSGSERVLFDPAGNFENDVIAERDDVLFGMNPALVDAFIDFHTQPKYNATAQTIYVPDDVANNLIARIKAHGPVPSAMCARSISKVLKETPGFESLAGTWYPEKLAAQYAELPNVITHQYAERVGSDGLAYILKWSPAYRPKYSVK